MCVQQNVFKKKKDVASRFACWCLISTYNTHNSHTSAPYSLTFSLSLPPSLSPSLPIPPYPSLPPSPLVALHTCRGAQWGWASKRRSTTQRVKRAQSLEPPTFSSRRRSIFFFVCVCVCFNQEQLWLCGGSYYCTKKNHIKSWIVTT